VDYDYLHNHNTVFTPRSEKLTVPTGISLVFPGLPLLTRSLFALLAGLRLGTGPRGADGAYGMQVEPGEHFLTLWIGTVSLH